MKLSGILLQGTKKGDPPALLLQQTARNKEVSDISLGHLRLCVRLLATMGAKLLVHSGHPELVGGIS